MWRRAAETAHRSGDHDRALQVLDEMAKTLPRPLPSWWHLMRARYLTRAEQPRAALTEYELAQAAADNCPPRDRAEATAHLADLLVQLGRYADARRAAGEALAIARGRPGCASILVLASAALGFSQAYLDDPDAGRDTVEQALAAAQKHGAHTDVLRAHLHLAELLTGPLNELESGVEVARRGAAQAEKWGLGRTYGSRLLAVAANGMFRAGRWADAEAAIDTGLRHRPSGVADVELLLARARVCLAYGDLDAAESDLNAVETLTAGGGSARHLLPLATLRAGLALWRGRHAEAREAVEHGLSRYDDQTEDLEVRAALVWHGLRAEAEAPAYAAGRIAALRQAAGQLTQESGNAAVPVRDAVAGYLALCEAELSRISGESSVALWERAAHTWESRHHPYPAAYARLRHAEALYYTERFRNATAGTSLKRAYRAAADLGARPLAAEIRDLASRARVQLEEADEGPDLAEAADEAALPAGPLAKLTAREREVLELVAAGHTNQEIGKSLFISGSTVGVHISKILAKLQVRSRLQASTIYRRWRPDSDR
jgi:DNA-binding CsgD family transcriptional regulator